MTPRQIQFRAMRELAAAGEWAAAARVAGKLLFESEEDA
jgi:hypothetical protein